MHKKTKSSANSSLFGQYFNLVLILTLLGWMTFSLPSVKAAMGDAFSADGSSNLAAASAPVLSYPIHLKIANPTNGTVWKITSAAGTQKTITFDNDARSNPLYMYQWNQAYPYFSHNLSILDASGNLVTAGGAFYADQLTYDISNGIVFHLINMTFSSNFPSGTYKIAIQYTLGSQQVAYSESGLFTIQNTWLDSSSTPPSAPKLTATAMSTSTIHLSWTPSVDNTAVAGYKIFKCQGSCTPVEFTTVTGTSYDDTNLSANTTYKYAVSSFDASGNMGAKSTDSAKTLSDSSTDVPSTPAASTKFSINDRVQSTSGLNVRSQPSTSASILGRVGSGIRGLVVNGPMYGNGYWWWRVNFEGDPLSGWSVENYLKNADPIVTTTTTPSQASTPTITITSPNGGHTYAAGSNVNITWTSHNVPAGSSYTLYTVNASGSRQYLGGASSDVNSYGWTIPSTLPAGQYKVFIGMNGNFSVQDSSTQDTSDSYFTITNSAQPAQVYCPATFACTPVSSQYPPIPSASGPATSGSCPTGYICTPIGTSVRPNISSVTPSSGNLNAVITIAGTNLSGASSIEFFSSSGQFMGSLTPSSSNAQSVSFNLSGAFTYNLSGTYEIEVVTNNCAGGCSSNMLPFTVISSTPTPVTLSISSISPASASQSNLVTINGSAFAYGASVNFMPAGSSGVVASVVPNSVTATQMAFSLPYLAPGSYSVKVTYANQSSNTFPFTVVIPAINPTPTTIPTITVTSPNGGESLAASSQSIVTWTAQSMPAGSSVYIYLVNSSGGRTQLYQGGAFQSGSFAWTIPSGQAAGQYKIQVTQAGNESVQDMSDAYFNITPFVTQTAPPSITVTSPNGGESIVAGTQKTITWTVQNMPSGATEYVYLVNSLGAKQVINLMGNVGTSGSTVWSVPITQAPGSYKIQVSLVGNESVQDMSDAYFNVTQAASSQAPAATLTGISPSSTATGSTVTINGSGFSSGGTVYFSLQNGTYASQATPTFVSASQLSVTVPYLAQGTYNVQVGYGSTMSNSVTFTVSAAATQTGTPSVTITAPNGGQTYAAGSNVTVTWTSQNVPAGSTYTLYTVNSAGANQYLGGAASSVNSLSATIPATLPAGQYKILITRNGDSSTQDSSDSYFSVTGPSKTVSTVSPASAAAGSVITITGTNFAPGDSVYFTPTNGAAPSFFAANPASATSISLNVPGSLASGAYNVKVGTLASMSNQVSFTVQASAANSAMTISSVSPSSAVAGTLVTISGSNFQGGEAINLLAPTGTPISFGSSFQSPPTGMSFYVPGSVPPGTYMLLVRTNVSSSNSVPFTVTAPASSGGTQLP